MNKKIKIEYYSLVKILNKKIESVSFKKKKRKH